MEMTDEETTLLQAWTRFEMAQSLPVLAASANLTLLQAHQAANGLMLKGLLVPTQATNKGFEEVVYCYCPLIS